MNKVYLVQEVLRRNDTTGQFVPSLDHSDAVRYGELVVLLQPGRIALSPAPMMAELRSALRNFCDDDYILPTGDTAAIAAAAMVAGSMNRGRVKVLSWDGRSRQYMPIQLSLFNGE